MQLLLDLKISPPQVSLSYTDKILMVGSCFTAEIGKRLHDLKFPILQNPNGILYDPLSICKSINLWIDNIQQETSELFYLDELWHSWKHHSAFSGVDKESVIMNINSSTSNAHDFLGCANWLFITLGTSMSHHLIKNGESVANCHKAPSAMFHKKMLSVSDIECVLRETLNKLMIYNPSLRIILTVSPVRHLNNGLVSNTISKARLFEAATSMSKEFPAVYYFPAYELVIDVLRDYRFYEPDMVHPNQQAADFVFDKFIETVLNPADLSLLNDIKSIVSAKKHKPFHHQTEAYANFRKAYLAKAKSVKAQHPGIELEEEIIFFGD